jgi:hypothetical protein
MDKNLKEYIINFSKNIEKLNNLDYNRKSILLCLSVLFILCIIFISID